MGRSSWGRLAWAAVIAVALVLVLQAFVVDVYRVASGSMEPTLHGPDDATDGERVLVRYGGGDRLERFDLAVVLVDGETEPMVKRVAARGGESVMISGGDLWIDGHRLPPDAPRPDWIAIFDEALQPIESGFPGLELHPPGSDGMRRVDARGAQGFDYAPRATDSYFDGRGRLIEGALPVNDLALELDVALEQSGAQILLALTEEGERFVASFAAQDADVTQWRVRASRESVGGELRELADRVISVPPGAPRRVRLANRDNVLMLDVGGKRVVTSPYADNARMQNAPDPFYRHLLPRASLLSLQGKVAIANLRLSRDVHYTGLGRFAIETPLELAPDELFLLGDHSSESRDSRTFGPVRASAVLGRPTAVLWPWRRMRALRGARAEPSAR